LRQPDGATLNILKVRNYRSTSVTYDLTVAEIHTYYVLAGPATLLVHNCPQGSSDPGDIPDLFDPDSGSHNSPNLGSATRGDTRRASEEVGDEAKTRSSSVSSAPGAGTQMAKDLGGAHTTGAAGDVSPIGSAVTVGIVVARGIQKARRWWRGVQ
jgi:hypothetical protein